MNKTGEERVRGIGSQDFSEDDDNAPWTPEDACLLGLPVEDQDELVRRRTYPEASDALNVVLRLWPRSHKHKDDDEMEDIA